MTARKSTKSQASKQTVEQTASERASEIVEALFADSETVSAQALADALERNAKTVRAYLRAIKSRDQSQFKNAQYAIDSKLASKVAEHFVSAKRVS
jgi:DNA-binding CsgD family transcriptional regulator